ncbi:biotin transporter BioY [Neomegalonema perideroedes]|uniref:biotin transporter BioY n=1 Tax=Neomegalonema perideroedes TaxID=217219 RepID=UPI0003821F48|nr:biotin transporter BioY [Neomegalonema perideroedes]
MTNLAPAYSPLRLESRPLVQQAAAVAFGSLILAVASRLEVPLYPVPVTMQTFAVGLIGALYGWRLGAITVLAWLLQGAAGLPVLAGGVGGLAKFVGPTAGYLYAFPLLAMIAGFLAERGWNGKKPLLAFAGLVGAHLIHLSLGAAWLAYWLGGDVQKAFVLGFAPFLIGLVLKSALAAATLKGAETLGARR